VVEQDTEKLLPPSGTDNKVQVIANIDVPDKQGFFPSHQKWGDTDQVFSLSHSAKKEVRSGTELMPPYLQPVWQNENTRPP
jgi:hypothetical protein